MTMDDNISRQAVLDLLKHDVWNDVIEAIEALPSADPWIPIKWHEITEEEREEEGYPKSWDTILDCEMPADEQEIFVTTKWGTTAWDTCYIDDGYSLDSGWDWIDDIVAWMPAPGAYKGGTNET